MKIKFITMLLLAVAFWGCENSSLDYPEWFNGKYLGYIGQEQDTLEFRFELQCNRNDSSSVLDFFDSNGFIDLKVNRITKNSIWFYPVKCSDSFKYLCDYRFELNKLDDSTSFVFIQALPFNEDDFIYLGQATNQ